MTIYIVVTTSLFNDCPIREEQYRKGIKALQTYCAGKPYKVIILENNGKRQTFLDEFGFDVFYTENNKLPVSNKGVKELRDIFDCISICNIQEDDFIVKLTGRYELQETSEFFNALQNLELSGYDCIVRYGSYTTNDITNTEDCATGLIGMRCRYIQDISYPDSNASIEMKWAEATHQIPFEKICRITTLGINMYRKYHQGGII